MNDDHPPREAATDEPVEARIVAWVLGEASAFEASELQRLCRERPALADFHRNILAVHGMLAETHSVEAQAGWKLPAAKRRMIEERLGAPIPAAVAVSEKSIRRSGRRALFAIAACLAITVVMARLLLVSPEKIGDPTEAFNDPDRDASGVSLAPPSPPDAPEAELALAVESAAVEGNEFIDRDKTVRSRVREVPMAGRLAGDAVAPAAAAAYAPAEVDAPARSLAAASADLQDTVDELVQPNPLVEQLAHIAPQDDGNLTGARRDSAFLGQSARDAAETELLPSEEPTSTFSLHLSDASFQSARAAIARGERPDPALVKPEEFYNAVDYGDPAPSAGESVAGLVEQSLHPIIPNHNLVRISLKTAAGGRPADRPLRLTLLVDQSASMAGDDRRETMALAAEQLASLLNDDDLVNIIGFSRTPRLLEEGLRGVRIDQLAAMIGNPPDSGGTSLDEALGLAEEIALRHYASAAQNRVVVFIDGTANLADADPERLAARVAAMRQHGLALDIAGIGSEGLNDRLLDGLARHGNGRYHVMNGADGGDDGDDHFARQLAGAFRPAAENMEVQVIFNPERVAGYRLIGFDAHRLRPDDLRAESEDAAEPAAEAAGVALYQVRPLPEGRGEIGEVRVRFREAASGRILERSWVIPYDPAAAPFDRASPSLQLAGLSMLAAEKLRGGEPADAIDFRQFAGAMAAVRKRYESSGKVAAMLEMVTALE